MMYQERMLISNPAPGGLGPPTYIMETNNIHQSSNCSGSSPLDLSTSINSFLPPPPAHLRCTTSLSPLASQLSPPMLPPPPPPSPALPINHEKSHSIPVSTISSAVPSTSVLINPVVGLNPFIHSHNFFHNLFFHRPSTELHSSLTSNCDPNLRKLTVSGKLLIFGKYLTMVVSICMDVLQFG